MKLCQFSDCFNTVSPNRTNLRKVYCRYCVDTRFNGKVPVIIEHWGGVDTLFTQAIVFTKSFAERHDITVFSLGMDIPRIKWSTALAPVNRQFVYGTADLNRHLLTLFVSRFKSELNIVQTFIHEIIHFTVGIMLNAYHFSGHGPLFWKLLFDFLDSIQFPYDLME